MASITLDSLDPKKKKTSDSIFYFLFFSHTPQYINCPPSTAYASSFGPFELFVIFSSALSVLDLSEASIFHAGKCSSAG